MENKTLDNKNVEDAKSKVSDVKVYGDVDTFTLLCKASSESEGWMKSTKVCNVDGGCLVQVSTQQRNPDGSYTIAEALTYVPTVQIDTSCEPRKLVPIVYKFGETRITSRTFGSSLLKSSIDTTLYLKSED